MWYVKNNEVSQLNCLYEIVTLYFIWFINMKLKWSTNKHLKHCTALVDLIINVDDSWNNKLKVKIENSRTC